MNLSEVLKNFPSTGAGRRIRGRKRPAVWVSLGLLICPRPTLAAIRWRRLSKRWVRRLARTEHSRVALLTDAFKRGQWPAFRRGHELRIHSVSEDVGMIAAARAVASFGQPSKRGPACVMARHGGSTGFNVSGNDCAIIAEKWRSGYDNKETACRIIPCGSRGRVR